MAGARAIYNEAMDQGFTEHQMPHIKAIECVPDTPGIVNELRNMMLNAGALRTS